MILKPIKERISISYDRSKDRLYVSKKKKKKENGGGKERSLV
jgi:hypothetical protein